MTDLGERSPRPTEEESEAERRRHLAERAHRGASALVEEAFGRFGIPAELAMEVPEYEVRFTGHMSGEAFSVNIAKGPVDRTERYRPMKKIEVVRPGGEASSVVGGYFDRFGGTYDYDEDNRTYTLAGISEARLRTVAGCVEAVDQEHCKFTVSVSDFI